MGDEVQAIKAGLLEVADIVVVNKGDRPGAQRTASQLRAMLVAVLGGLIGILMMIPLRRALIVAQHGLLKYPEGTACAEVLKAGASRESQEAASESAKREMEALGGATTSAKTIFSGLGIGLLYKTLMDPQGFRFWKSTPERVFGPPFAAGSISAEISPELLGVGYIIGPRIASIMCAGGVLAYLVLIPMIKYFGASLATPLAPEAATSVTAPQAEIDPAATPTVVAPPMPSIDNQ